MRFPCVAGTFYPGKKEELQRTIKQCFLHSYGAQATKKKLKTNSAKKTQKEEIIAGISPHAGYVYSGPCQSHIYNAIANTIKQNREKEFTVIVLGVSHQGYSSCVSNEDFVTPYGILKNNIPLQRIIQTNTSLPINNPAHEYEHSIEVQLPFIQYIADETKKEIDFVPIIIGKESLQNIESLATQLDKTIEQYESEVKNGKVIIIASSDFTHYGKEYGYNPYEKEENEKELVTSHDKKAIELITKLDVNQLKEYYSKTQITICGIYPILVLISLQKKRNEKNLDKKKIKARLLSYYKSSEIMSTNTPNGVSYASIGFYE